MKKMKIAGLLLACALPLSANAADVCLSINNGVMLVKFKKPSVAKGTYTTKLDPVLYVPEYGLVGMGSGTIVVHTNGEVDFGLNLSAGGSAPMKNDGELSATIYVARYNVDKKTFTGGRPVHMKRRIFTMRLVMNPSCLLRVW